MSILLKAKSNKKFKVDSDFAWHTADGRILRPSEMSTSHVFFTLRMIWNHVVPDEFRIKPYQKYVFDEEYDEEYMNLATIAMIQELATRNDLNSYFRRCLAHMKRCLSDQKVLN